MRYDCGPLATLAHLRQRVCSSFTACVPGTYSGVHILGSPAIPILHGQRPQGPGGSLQTLYSLNIEQYSISTSELSFPSYVKLYCAVKLCMGWVQFQIWGAVVHPEHQCCAASSRLTTERGRWWHACKGQWHGGECTLKRPQAHAACRRRRARRCGGCCR